MSTFFLSLSAVLFGLHLTGQSVALGIPAGCLVIGLLLQVMKHYLRDV